MGLSLEKKLDPWILPIVISQYSIIRYMHAYLILAFQGSFVDPWKIITCSFLLNKPLRLLRKIS